MYQEDMFVLLAPGAEEEVLTPEELRQRLQTVLSEFDGILPRDLQQFDTVADQAHHLAATACEFEVRPGEAMQWFAVRLEK
jgi:hypothetical protein